MTMEAMVEFLETQGFDAKKEYDRNMHLYVFTITRDGVTVTDNFEYPVTRNFSLKDKAQRDFLYNLMTVWEDRKFYSRFKDKKGESNMTRQYYVQYAEKLDEIKKGESSMKDNDNLMYALAQTTAGHLHLMGKPYPVMVKDVTVDGRCAGEAATLLTVEVVGRYGDPNDKLYPKYPNNSDGTIRAVFNSLDLNQKRAVYEIIGRAINDEPSYSYSYGRDLPKIKDVIFNPPATIVFWADNTKTVVKCQEGDDFDPEKGLTMAITKKLFGNKGNYCEEIKKWTKKYNPEPVEFCMNGFSISEIGNVLREAFGLPPEKKEEPVVAETPETADPEKRWKIWWKKYDENDNVVGSGVHHTDYKCKSSARRAAHRMFDDHSLIDWWVSPENPWEKD